MAKRTPSRATAPFLIGVYVVEERISDWSKYPFHLPFVRTLDLDLEANVTVLVGENGSGKSTLLEAIAQLARLPVSGGSRNELADGEPESAPLADVLRPKFRSKPPDAFFFRADGLSDFAKLLDRRRKDPTFGDDPYRLYGGESLESRSHGQAVGFLLRSRSSGGLFLLDEPEAALSPKRQLEFRAHIEECASSGSYQFIIATHSPILMSIIGARVVNFDSPELPLIAPSETSHWKAFASVLGGRTED